MSKSVLIAIWTCLALGVLGAGVLGWFWSTRDRVAVAQYRLALPEGASMADVVAAEAELMRSDEVLKPVIADLDLLARWKMGSEEKALKRLNKNLTVKLSMGEFVKVIYRDRKQDRALEILDAINRRFARLRDAKARAGELPPVVPPKGPPKGPAPAPGGGAGAPLPATP